MNWLLCTPIAIAIVAGSAASLEIFWRQLWLAVSIPFWVSARRQSHQTNTHNSLSGRGRQRIVSQNIQNDFDTVSTSYFGPSGLACPGSSLDPVYLNYTKWVRAILPKLGNIIHIKTRKCSLYHSKPSISVHVKIPSTNLLPCIYE